MSVNVNRRHASAARVRRDRSSGPVVTGFAIDVPANPMSQAEKYALLDQMDGALWRHVSAKYGVSGALEHLAPRRTPAKVVARTARQAVKLGLLAVGVLAVAAVPPVLHGLGV